MVRVVELRRLCEFSAVVHVVAWGLVAGSLVACGGGDSGTGGQENAPPVPPPGHVAPLAGQQAPEMLQAESSVRSGSDVVGHINGEPVTAAEMDLEMRRIMRRMFGGQAPAEVPEGFRQQLEQRALRQLAVKAQLRKYAQANEVTVGETQIDNEVAQIEARLGGADALNEALERQGQDRDDLRRDIAEGKLLEGAVEYYRSHLPTPATEEVEQYYTSHKEQYTEEERVYPSHILLEATSETDPQVRQSQRAKADALRRQLVEGADFAALAREHSECPSAAEGGALGGFTRAQVMQMPPAFADAVLNQATGTVSEVVETQAGYHIIRVATHEQEHVRPLAEIEDQVTHDMQSGAVTEWLERLADEALGTSDEP